VLPSCWPRPASPFGQAQAPIYRSVSVTVALVAAALALARPADGHGIAGNRLFPGTLTFDDPAVADELVLPNFSNFEHPTAGHDVRDNRFNWAFSRLLTPTLAFGIDSGWVHRNWGGLGRSGFESTNLTLKGEVYRNRSNDESRARLRRRHLANRGRSHRADQQRGGGTPSAAGHNCCCFSMILCRHYLASRS
jgi:hypothetical protein